MRHDLIRRSFGDDAASVFTGRGSEINDPVRVADRFIIVFNDQHGVSKIAQTFERVQ